MFFIFGTPRSGTTFLKEVLNSSPNIYIPNETDFIVPIAFILDRIKDASLGKNLISSLVPETSDFKVSIGRYLSAEEIKFSVMEAKYDLSCILEGIYEALARKLKVQISGDKSPNDLGYLGILYKTGLFNSKIKIVHIVRDVRDVMLSLKSVGWDRSDMDKYFPHMWTSSNRNLKRFCSADPGRYLLVRYEDLIQNPHDSIGRICDFLEVEKSSEMMNWENMGLELRALDHHKNLGLPPLHERCYAWKRHPDLTEIFNWSKLAEVGLEEFGYELG